MSNSPSETAQATRILTVGVYIFWNYMLHRSYWHFEDSWLHYYVKHGNYYKLYGIHMLHLFTVIMYLIAAFRSPGFVEIKQHSNQLNSPKYCPICKIIRPRRSKHCYKCGKCIVKYDHHCIFTANCVGAHNWMIFVFYLMIQLLFLSWSIPLSFESIYFGINNINNIGYIQLIYRFGCCLGILCAGIGLFLLFVFHIYLIISNQTTYMYLKKYGCCSKKNNTASDSIYDAKHFDPDIHSSKNSLFSNLILFLTNPIPDDWTLGKVYDDITPKSEWLTNTNGIKNKYIDTAGVGCVPLPTFKQD